MSRLLLHACCVHCAAYCVHYWREQGHRVTLFWYNPNIHPFTEHQRRLKAMQTWAQGQNLSLIVSEDYEMIAYFRAVVGHEQERCRNCFLLRLSRTAREARGRNIPAFTTTLLISPYQKHELLKEVGMEVARGEGVEFLYADLRGSFRESHRLTRGSALYRQQYCGCVYSEWERFSGAKSE